MHLPDWKPRAGKAPAPLPEPLQWSQQGGQPPAAPPRCSHAGTQRGRSGDAAPWQGSTGAAAPGGAPSALPALTAARGSRGLIFTARAGLSAPICVCRGRAASAGLARAGSSVLARRQPPGRQPPLLQSLLRSPASPCAQIRVLQKPGLGEPGQVGGLPGTPCALLGDSPQP